MRTKRNLVFAIFLMLFQHNAMCQKLKIGDKAPDFETVDTNGDTIKLSNYKGQKVLIAFFRYAGCPVCNSRVHELIEDYDSFSSKGYKIIAIYESTNSTLKEYLSETPVPFAVIGDPTLILYKKYRVEKSFRKMVGSAFKKQPKEARKKGQRLFSKKYKRDGNLTRLPADFIVDENGILKMSLVDPSTSYLQNKTIEITLNGNYTIQTADSGINIVSTGTGTTTLNFNPRKGFAQDVILENTSLSSEELDKNLTENIIYPNPSHSKVYFENMLVKSEVLIYNLTGQLIKKTIIEQQENTPYIEVSDLPNGIYFLQNENLIYKLIKN